MKSFFLIYIISGSSYTESTDTENPNTENFNIGNSNIGTCPYCEKYFSMHLRRHIATVHLKLRPYKCEYCDSTFGTSGSRLRHVRDIHLKGNHGGVTEGGLLTPNPILVTLSSSATKQQEKAPDNSSSNTPIPSTVPSITLMPKQEVCHPPNIKEELATDAMESWIVNYIKRFCLRCLHYVCATVIKFQCKLLDVFEKR